MAIYTIRPEFTVTLGNTLYLGGQQVDLTPEEFEDHKHKLEGVDSTVTLENGDPNAGSGGNSGSCYPDPYISSADPPQILTGQQNTVSILGSFFTPDSAVTVSAGQVDNVTFISSNELIVTITTGSTAQFIDVTVDNGTVATATGLIEIITLPDGLVDLRLNGTVFSNSAIEIQSAMSFTRTVDGLLFAGANPWTSWARFVGDQDAWMWSRSTKKTVSWICKNTSSFMVGIGSRSNSPTSSAQYYQHEILAYTQTATAFSRLYGNNGTIGQGRTEVFSGNKQVDDIIKYKWTQNGEIGGTFAAYKIASPNPSDWLDDSNLINQVNLTAIASDEPLLCPSAIPRTNTGDNLYLGFILEDQ